MGLPTEIPSELQTRSLDVPDLGANEGAWTREDALAVIRSLEGTTVAVEAVTVCGLARVVLRPAVPSWGTGRIRGERSADYAMRSRAGAERFIQGYVPPGPGIVVYVLEFSTQNEAA